MHLRYKLQRNTTGHSSIVKTCRNGFVTKNNPIVTLYKNTNMHYLSFYTSWYFLYNVALKALRGVMYIKFYVTSIFSVTMQYSSHLTKIVLRYKNVTKRYKN